MGKEKEFTETLLTRMTAAERPLIRKAASAVELSESRFLVISALLLSDFGTVEELRTALQLGRYLIEVRQSAVMQVRFLGNQLKLLRSELKAGGQVSPEKLEGALAEATATLKQLGATWRGASVV
jgi:hypothetical protein